jgi:hypothetical protein
MTIFKNLRPHGRRLSLVAFCLLSVWPPLSAQTGKELMADACYNEAHKREHNARARYNAVMTIMFISKRKLRQSRVQFIA